ncbi:MAG: TRAP transporter substrate-binding protein [Acetobacteraceae bacterium]|nr:TRAP transporter substrate-binding protein [Acetobacteraceae bacterium]
MRRRVVLGSGLAALAAPGLARAQTRWVMASAYPDGNYHTQNIRRFLTETEQASGGKLAVQFHSNAALLPMPQIKRAVQTGQIQLGEILMAAYGNEDPLFEVDFIPFLADTWDRAKALHEVTEPLLRARFERQGMTLLYCGFWPSQAFWTRTPVSKLEDLRGTRFRAQAPTLVRLAELLGAQPVVVQQAEVPQAFAAGIINVMITSAATGVDTSAWDYTRYATFMGMTYVRNAILVNTRALMALEEPVRAAMVAAARAAGERSPGLGQESERTMTARLRQQGMVLPEIDPAFLADLRGLGARMAEEWAQKAGPEGRAALERYRAMIR